MSFTPAQCASPRARSPRALHRQLASLRVADKPPNANHHLEELPVNSARLMNINMEMYFIVLNRRRIMAALLGPQIRSLASAKG